MKKKEEVYISKHGKKKKQKKVRLRYGRIILCIIIVSLLVYLFLTYVKIPITNIFVSGNSVLSDQEIIDAAGLRDYPSILTFTNKQIKKKLKKNEYIADVTVRKDFRKVYIDIKENYPLFYNSQKKHTVMYDGRTIKGDLNGPLLLNYVTDNVYELFIEKMQLLEPDILDRISEIKYDPNTVDPERFLFTMSDGNYVYITLEKIEVVNDYVNIIKTFEGKKGILYLDSGEYFEVIN